MVRAALDDRRAPVISAAAATRAPRHNGFNLLVGDGEQVAYASNRTSGALLLQSGIHGVSNLNTWRDGARVLRAALTERFRARPHREVAPHGLVIDLTDELAEAEAATA